MESGLSIFRNLYLAGHRFLWVLLHSIPSHFAQALVTDVSGAMGAVHYSLLQAELDFCFLWGRVAGSANNRYNLTCQKQIDTSLNTFFLKKCTRRWMKISRVAHIKMTSTLRCATLKPDCVYLGCKPFCQQKQITWPVLWRKPRPLYPLNQSWETRNQCKHFSSIAACLKCLTFNKETR